MLNNVERLNHSRPNPVCRRLVLLLVLSAQQVTGQIISGTISGSVVDPSDAAIPGATVVLTNENVQSSRVTKSDQGGLFGFASVQPGTYRIRISAAGFGTLERTGNVLTANSLLDLGRLVLAVGETRESVTVMARGDAVQTGSSENAAVLGTAQLDTLSVRGRDVTSLLQVLPGVSVGAINEVPNGPGYGNSLPNIMGHPASWTMATVDGLETNDIDAPQFFSSPNMDSLAEAQVQLNNFQAQYGGMGGAIINLITKSGTNEYHGTAYWYKRHEMFNANNFFNNATRISLPLYRYNTEGASLGGPIPIPRMRDKLYFFYSIENWQVRSPQAVIQRTMPTVAERNGDFSQSLDLNGALRVVRDPLNSGAPFAGNMLPANRITAAGKAMLNVMPLPNLLDANITKGNYNYQTQVINDMPKRNHVFRVDYRPSDKDNLYLRGLRWDSNSAGGLGIPAGGPNFPLATLFYRYMEESAAVNHTHIFTPAIVNEFSIAVRNARESGGANSDQDWAKIQRTQAGINVPTLYGNNPFNIIPRLTFGGVPSPPQVNFDGRFPIYEAQTETNLTEALTITHSKHTIKTGFNLFRGASGSGLNGWGNPMGTFDFTRDTTNPLDSNWDYSNALLGNFRSYTESSTSPQDRLLIWNMAGFVQDTWKVSRTLTLDLGVRVPWHTWWKDLIGGGAAAFVPSRYDAVKAPVLFRPASTPEGRRALNPQTGELAPAVYIGGFVPGTGSATNGIVLNTDPNYPDSFRNPDPPRVEPRIGFAYDPRGNGKMAIRGSVGIFHQVLENTAWELNAPFNPPVQFNPVIYYNTIASVSSSQGLLFPSNAYGTDRNAKTASVYNYTLNVQRDVGLRTVLSVAYVGWLARHEPWSQNLNTVPYGARFLPQNADPASPAVPLSDNFFRPYPGYGNVTMYSNNGTANYNALQVSANRRFARSLGFGFSYTWSKSMNYVDTDNANIPTYRPLRVWNYGKAGFDQTHIFVFQYTWDLPAPSRVVHGAVVRRLLDNWRLSGITTFASGTPLGIALSTVDGADITGGGDGSRVNVVKKAQLAWGDRSLTRWFDPTVFARPGRGDPGNAPKDVFRGPGINNWDATLFKEFALGKETRLLQLRWEVYNLFNHTQYLGVDNGARFDLAGNQVNARLGQVISARNPRIMQVSLRFKF